MKILLFWQIIIEESVNLKTVLNYCVNTNNIFQSQIQKIILQITKKVLHGAGASSQPVSDGSVHSLSLARLPLETNNILF